MFISSPVSVFSAAKWFCNKSGWTLSNLELQKMIYLAHMFYMGKHDKHEPLIGGVFQAWDYGPVNPELYHQLKDFGPDFVTPDALSFSPDIPESHNGIKDCNIVINQIPRNRLVAITHWEHGAWRKIYRPGIHHLVIPNEEIVKEWEKREEYAREQ